MPKTLMSDLASLINSDPAWKVSKGNRSSSRRARKTIAKGVKCFKEQGCKRAEEFDMPVSEPEKCGVVSSACRFSGKAEHVPIKKRRFMFRSPSPPPVIAAPPVEETGLLTESHEVSNRSAVLESSSSGTNISSGVKKLELPGGKFAGDDFSGISILAAAACSSNLGNSSNSLQEDLVNSTETSAAGFTPSISTMPVGEVASTSTTVDCPLEVIANDKDVKPACIGTNSATSAGNVPCRKEEEMAVNQRVIARDDRLHWDLNVVMDAWEESLDDPVPHNDTQHNLSQDVTTNHHDSFGKMAITCAEKSSLMLDESKVLSAHSFRGSKAVCDIGDSLSASPNVSMAEKCVMSSINSSMDNATYKVEDTQCLNLHTAKTTIAFAVSGPEHTDQPSMSQVYDPTVKKFHQQQIFEGFDSTTAEPFNEVKKIGASSVSVDVRDSEEANRVCSVSTEPSNSTSTICRDLKPIDIKVEDISKPQGGETVCNSAVTMDLSEIPSAAPKKLCVPPFEYTSKGNLDKNLNYSGQNENAELKEGMGVQDYAIPVAGVVATSEHQDYDSQYEDGELRESNECSWEEHNNVNREAEDVECRSNNIRTCDVNLCDNRDSGSGLVDSSMNVKQRVDAAVTSVDLNVCNEAKVVGDCRAQHESNKIDVGSAEESMDLLSGTEQPEKCMTSSDMSVDDDVNNEAILAHADGLVNSKEAETEEPKPLRRAIQSRIERPISRDRLFNDDRLSRTGNRFESGAVRSFERSRYSFHNQDRGRHGVSDGSIDYHRNFKSQYSPNFYRRSKLSDDNPPERENIGYDGTQDDVSYSHHVHPNSQCNADKEPCLHPRHKYYRRFSPDRGEGFGRGRPFRYGLAAESREGRGRYNGPSPEESFQSSLKYRRPLSRRERSLSPFGPRVQSNLNHIRGKSPSRSRSRSPVTWNPSRGRLGGVNTFIRHRSRSPNFRSDVRTQRLRSPNQQPGFGADHPARYRPITRTQSSPTRNRWNSGRQDELCHFRDFGYKQRENALDRSPGRIRMTGERDNVIDSRRTLKPDGYSRISDRTSEAGASRGLGYADNYDHRRKPYNFLRPARRSYEDGVGNILDQDIDDCFPARSNIRDRDGPSFRGRGGFRSFDRRISEMPRRFRGEQHTFMNEQDGKFDSHSKQFADDVISSSGNLNSEEHCRQTHMRRYTDPDGANRGHRYDNYEDRRKQYGSINHMRRSDSEGTKERLNHEADENFQDAPDDNAMGAKGFDGHNGAALTRTGEDGDPAACGQADTHY